MTHFLKQFILIPAFLLCWLVTANAYIITFAPEVSVSEECTDNIFLANNENKESDFITVVASGFTLGFEEKSAGLSFFYSPEYSNYSIHDDNNTWRHIVRSNVWSELTGNTRVDISGSYVRTEDPDAGDVDDEENIGLDAPSDRRIRSVFYTKTAGFRFTHTYGAMNSTTVGYDFRSVINDDKDLAEDYAGHTPYIRLIYWPSPNKWGVRLGCSLVRGEYEEDLDDFAEWRGYIRLIREVSRRLDIYVQYNHSNMEYDGETENYQIYNPSVGMNYDFSKDSTLGLSIGYFLQDMEESEETGGISATAEFEDAWANGQGTTNISYSNGYQVSMLDTEELGFSLYHEADISASYAFTRKFSGDVAVSVRWNKYEENLSRSEREETLSIVAAGFNWQVKTWLNVRSEISSRNLNSTIDYNDYREKRAFLELTFTPPRPIRKVY